MTMTIAVATRSQAVSPESIEPGADAASVEPGAAASATPVVTVAIEARALRPIAQPPSAASPPTL